MPDFDSYNRYMPNQHRIAISAVTLCFFSITLSAQQFHQQLSPAVKEHILDGPFTDVTKGESMPNTVKQAFAKITGEPSFALANPGENYQVTDVDADRILPRRRLVFAGVAGNEWFVHYEKGGIGHSYSIVVFKVNSQSGLEFVWGGVGFHGAKDLDQLRKMVAAGQFSDEIKNYW
jgi:hypothetical protein